MLKEELTLWSFLNICGEPTGWVLAAAQLCSQFWEAGALTLSWAHWEVPPVWGTWGSSTWAQEISRTGWAAPACEIKAYVSWFGVSSPPEPPGKPHLGGFLRSQCHLYFFEVQGFFRAGWKSCQWSHTTPNLKFILRIICKYAHFCLYTTTYRCYHRQA